HVGEQTFFAFVHTRIFGVPVPVPLEVAANGRAIINVSGFRITTTSLPAAPRGISYSQSRAAENGPPPFTWSVSAGDLPPGLSLSAAGEISGIPTTRGDFSFTVSAIDGDSIVATKPLSIAVRDMEGTWTGTFNGTFRSFDGSIVRESPGQIRLVLTQDGTALSGTVFIEAFLAPATGTASGTFTGTGISEFSMTATTQSGCTGTFTGTATVDVVAGSMTANYSGSDCNGTITGAVAQLTRGN
ncbi:MAG TPA: putative Ig domain-containing protein, partial [Longimicrobiales bacterium]|nr:putative Ig domain-containing protein [Longimicrobiales bacterium]